MKKLLLTVILSGTLLSFNTSTHFEESSVTTVYICKGKYSKKYHYKKIAGGSPIVPPVFIKQP